MARFLLLGCFQCGLIIILSVNYLNAPQSTLSWRRVTEKWSNTELREHQLPRVKSESLSERQNSCTSPCFSLKKHSTESSSFSQQHSRISAKTLVSTLTVAYKLMRSFFYVYLKGTYHAKCTFVRLFYMNMCPRCSRELTKCQKTQPSLFSSIPKSLKKGLQRI